MMRNGRRLWTVIHRCIGLAVAGFLFLAGLTGAIISWDQELDALLNRDLHNVSSKGAYLDPLAMAHAIETRDPRAWVVRVPLAFEEGRSAQFLVAPKVNAKTDEPYDIGYNEVYVDPVSGQEVGRRNWGHFSPDRRHIVSFLYNFHHTLCMPELWGEWILGAVALLWLFDCFVGFYLTLPRRDGRGAPQRQLPAWLSRWRPAWFVRWRQGGYRRTFDIHRAFGLWTWVFLAVLASSAATLNLFPELFRPILLSFSDFTPRPTDTYKLMPANQPIQPHVPWDRIIEQAKRDAAAREWDEPVNRAFYAYRNGYYSVSFFKFGDYLGVNGMPHKRLFYDAGDGRFIGMRKPWKGSGADIFIQAQFPVHSGRILGLPGRIMISAMGIVVAILSVTGVVVWWRKRSARTLRHQKSLQLDVPARRAAE